MIGVVLSPHSSLREAWARARRLGRPLLSSWTEPVPYEEPLTFFRRGASSGARTYWERPEDGRAIVGLGAAHAFEPSGPDRFAALGAAWRVLLAEIGRASCRERV